MKLKSWKVSRQAYARVKFNFRKKLWKIKRSDQTECCVSIRTWKSYNTQETSKIRVSSKIDRTALTETLLNAAYCTDKWGFARLYDVVLKIFANPQRTRCPASKVSKFWQNKQSCFFLTAKLSCYARYLWIKFHWEKDTSVRLYLACDGRISFIWPFEGKESELHFY